MQFQALVFEWSLEEAKWGYPVKVKEAIAMETTLDLPVQRQVSRQLGKHATRGEIKDTRTPFLVP